MSRPTRPAANDETTDEANPLAPADGAWHCSHLYYSFDRERLNRLSSDERGAIAASLAEVLDPEATDSPTRLQTQIVSGHKADFGVMLLDPDPLQIDAVHQRLMAGPAGAVLKPGYSFVSVTEISEYVPSVEQYGQRSFPRAKRPILLLITPRSRPTPAGCKV